MQKDISYILTALEPTRNSIFNMSTLAAVRYSHLHRAFCHIFTHYNTTTLHLSHRWRWPAQVSDINIS